jgi:hypothetical protein
MSAKALIFGVFGDNCLELRQRRFFLCDSQDDLIGREAVKGLDERSGSVPWRPLL